MRRTDIRPIAIESSTRRAFITLISTGGAAALAGCTGGESGGSDGGETSGASGGDEGESGPLEADPEELLPAADSFGDGWEKQDNGMGGSLSPIELDGDTAKESFVTDAGQQGISVEVTVFESVDEAMSGYEDMRDADSSDDSIEDIDIASEGYLFGAFDIVYFRDANVIGILSHVSDTSSTKPVEYAADWHDTWRN